jgi:hypothetical protein
MVFGILGVEAGAATLTTDLGLLYAQGSFNKCPDSFLVCNFHIGLVRIVSF